jgi:hypothetical protein
VAQLTDTLFHNFSGGKVKAYRQLQINEAMDNTLQ